MARKELTAEQKAQKAANEKARRARLKEAAAAQHTPPTDAEAPKLTACMLVYDIPSNSKLSNPSGQLRRLGFRANLSCWVLPEGSLPLNLIHELNEGGANCRVTKFDAGEGAKLVAWALETMKKDVAEQVARARKNLDKAVEKHLTLTPTQAQVAEVREEALAAYELRAGAICEALETLLDDVQHAIRGFGVDPAALSLAGAAAAFESFQVGIAARAAEYAAATKALRDAAQKTGDTNLAALANAASQDLVPAGVMADALREAGDDTAADRLQASTAPETFSLADAE